MNYLVLVFLNNSINRDYSGVLRPPVNRRVLDISALLNAQKTSLEEADLACVA
jgi:hypothetical protein